MFKSDCGSGQARAEGRRGISSVAGVVTLLALRTPAEFPYRYFSCSPAGDYKYGWSATPRRYQPADSAKLSRRSLDGHHGGAGVGSASGSRRSSVDLQHGGAGGSSSRPGSRRTSLDFHDPHAPAAAASMSPLHPHPHRTYVVTAEDPRIHKAQAGAAAAAVGQQSPPHYHGSQQQQHRPGSGRRTSMDRRRSVDQQGPWRLGSEQLQQHQQHQQQQQQAAQGQLKEANHKPQQTQGQGQQGAGGRRRSMSSRDGRASLDGRSNASSTDSRSTAPKAAQPQKAKEAAKASAHDDHKDSAACSLRVDAPEWKPTWVAAAGAHKQPAPVEAVTAP